MRSAVKPKLVIVMAPKGGVGKTVCTMALLVAAKRAGLRVVGIGMDPQKSLELWGAARNRQRASPGGERFVDVPVETLPLRDYRRLATLIDVDIVIVDTPPGHQTDITDVEGLVALSDLILIPTGQTGQDLLHTTAFGRQLTSRNAFFVLNRVKRRTTSFTKAKNLLLKAGRVCPADIPDREAIHTAYEKGLVVADLGQPGSDDFDGLWGFVASELDLRLEGKADVKEDHNAA